MDSLCQGYETLSFTVNILTFLRINIMYPVLKLNVTHYINRCHRSTISSGNFDFSNSDTE